MELAQLESPGLLTDTVTSQTVYLNVLFPSKYRYYFELVGIPGIPIRIDHPFRLYFPQTIAVEWADPSGTNGIYLILGADPAFHPFGLLTIQVHLPQEIYDAILTAMRTPINSPADLDPPPEANAMGEVEFVLLSTDAGEQIKIDLVNTAYTPEIPVTVQTLRWNEVLYYVMDLPPISVLPQVSWFQMPTTFSSSKNSAWGSRVFDDVSWNVNLQELAPILPSPPSPPVVADGSVFEFAYTVGGVLGITFIDPRYCFLREWITFPPDWTSAIKDFAGV